MKLIKEVFDTTSFVVENKLGKGKEYFIEGIFLQSDVTNRNKRMYPEEIMDKEVGRYLKEQVQNNRAYGELGHPDGPGINLDRVSHMITSLRKEGTNYIGRAKILDTPMGQITKGLLDGGANLGVSSRALGSLQLNKEGVQVVQDDFMLSTAADIVADPSAPEAFVRGIMEGKEWVWDNGIIREVDVAAMHADIAKAKKRQLEERMLAGWTKFLKLLSE